MKNYTFIDYRQEMNLPDGVYNGRYNKENALVRLEGGTPVWVQFIGFIKQDEVRHSSIFDASGILHSSIELLVPAQGVTIN